MSDEPPTYSPVTSIFEEPPIEDTPDDAPIELPAEDPPVDATIEPPVEGALAFKAPPVTSIFEEPPVEDTPADAPPEPIPAPAESPTENAMALETPLAVSPAPEEPPVEGALAFEAPPITSIFEEPPVEGALAFKAPPVTSIFEEPPVEDAPVEAPPEPIPAPAESPTEGATALEILPALSPAPEEPPVDAPAATPVETPLAASLISTALPAMPEAPPVVPSAAMRPEPTPVPAKPLAIPEAPPIVSSRVMPPEPIPVPAKPPKPPKTAPRMEEPPPPASDEVRSAQWLRKSVETLFTPTEYVYRDRRGTVDEEVTALMRSQGGLTQEQRNQLRLSVYPTQPILQMLTDRYIREMHVFPLEAILSVAELNRDNELTFKLAVDDRRNCDYYKVLWAINFVRYARREQQLKAVACQESAYSRGICEVEGGVTGPEGIMEFYDYSRFGVQNDAFWEQFQDACVKFIIQKVFVEHVEVVGFSEIERFDYYQRALETVAVPMLRKALNAPSYKQELESYSDTERRLLLFLFGTTKSPNYELTKYGLDRNLSRILEANEKHWACLGGGASRDWFNFNKKCEVGIKTMAAKLQNENYAPVTWPDLIDAAWAYLLGYVDKAKGCDFLKAAELFSKAGAKRTLRPPEALLHMYSTAGALQPLSADDILDFPANTVRVQDWNEVLCIPEYTYLFLHSNIAYWVRLLNEMQGTKIAFANNQRIDRIFQHYIEIVYQNSNKKLLIRAEREQDYLFVQRHVELAQKLGSRLLMELAAPVSQQAASLVQKCQLLGTQIKPQATLDCSKLSDALDLPPEWPVPADLSCIEVPLFKAFLLQKVIPDRSVHYKVNAQCFNNMIALIDILLPFCRNGVVFSKVVEALLPHCQRDEIPPVVIQSLLSLFSIKPIAKDQEDVLKAISTWRSVVPDAKFPHPEYLKNLSTQFLQFLLQIAVGKEFDTVRDELNALKKSLKTLLRRNFEIFEYSQTEADQFRHSARFKNFWKGNIIFDTCPDQDQKLGNAFRQDMLQNIREEQQSKGKVPSSEPDPELYSKWGETPVERLEQLALCLEAARSAEPGAEPGAARSAEPGLRCSLRQLWFILLFGGRAVLDDFFNPNFTSEDEVNRCIKEVQNMSPRARSTLAVFYFWFNLERLGIKCVKSISVKTTYISTNLNLSVLPNFEGGEGSPYSEALRECMTGALPHFFSQNTIPGEYFRRIRHAIPYAVFSYWFGDFFKHVPENIQYKYSYCSEDEWPLMDKVFRSVFYGEPYCYDAVKCTFWDGSTSSGEMRDYNQNNSPLRFMELLGNSICSVDGTYLRGITARGYNSLSLSTHVPPDVDIAALNLLPVGMWKNDFSFDGVIARVAFDQTYKGAFLRDLEDRFIYLLKEENPVRDPQTNQVDLIFEERCEALKKAPSKLNCIGHVVDVLPPSFFPKVLWFKEFLQFPGEHLFVKTPKNQRGNPKNWSFNKWSALYYQGESDLLNTWIFNKFVNHSVPARALCHLVTCQNVFDIDDALSPIFVEKIPLDSPFMFGNTFVCIDDEPRWKVAVACGRQYSMLPPDAVDYEQFLAQSGLPLRSALLPIASAPPEGKPAMFAKQMFDSRLIKDLYDDIETVDKLYVRLLLLASDSSSMAEDWPGMPEATFTEFQERLKDNNRLLFDPEVFEYVLNYFFDSKAFEPKTRDLWRPYRFVFETLVGQALHEIGHSLLQYNDTKKKLYFASSDIAAATPKRILDFLDGTEMPALSGNNFENAEAESQAWTEAMERCKAKDAAAAAQAAAKAAARHKAAQEKADQAKAARAEAAQEKARQDKAARKKRDEERAASVKGRGGKLQPSRGPPPQKGGGKLQPSRGSPRKGP